MIRIKIILCIFCFALCTLSFAQISRADQRAIDSVKALFRIEKTDTQRVKYQLVIAVVFRKTNADSALAYAEKALQLCKEKKFGKGEAEAYNTFAKIYAKQSDYKTALKYYTDYLKKATGLNSKRKMADAHQGIGNMYFYQGDYPEAMKNYLASARYNEETGNKLWLANNYTNIGVIQMREKSYSESVKTYLKALKAYEALGDSNGITACYKNIGVSYAEQANQPEALKYYLKCLEIEKIRKDEDIVATYNNIAATYLNMHDLDKSQQYWEISYGLLQKSNDVFSKAYCLQGLASVCESRKNFPKAIGYYLESVKVCRQAGMKHELMETYSNISKMYVHNRDFENAYKYESARSVLKDSLYNEKNSQVVAEMQEKYESEKKDKDLLKKDAEIRQQQAESREKSLQRNAFIAGFVLMVLLAFFIFRSFRINKKASRSISMQKAIIEEKQKEILDSIHYARRIQGSLMASEKNIEKMLDKLMKKEPRE